MNLGIYKWSTLNRFASADTIVPDPGNPQSYNRYSYVLNSPINFTDPTGHRECGALDNCEEDNISHLTPTVVVAGGSDVDLGIEAMGPLVEEQLPVWQSNPWDYETINIQYPGSKNGQYQNMLEMDLGDPKVMVCYSAGAEACLLYASFHPSVETVVLLGPTFTGAAVEGGERLDFDGWSGYMEQILTNGTNIIIYDDGWRMNNEANTWAQSVEVNLADAGVPSGTALVYIYWPNEHYDNGGLIRSGTNNKPLIAAAIYFLVGKVQNE